MIPGFLSTETVNQMKDSCSQLISDFNPSDHPIQKFSTENQESIMGQYFLESAEKISYFYEAGALDSDGQLLVQKDQAINKVGHGLHIHHATFRDIAHSDRIKAIAHSLDFKKPCVLQSMIIYKVNLAFLVTYS